MRANLRVEFLDARACCLRRHHVAEDRDYHDRERDQVEDDQGGNLRPGRDAGPDGP